MAQPKVMSGARAYLAFYDPNQNKAVAVGIFHNVSYGLTYDAQPIYILGRYSAAAIEYTAQEAVTITASGWRVIDHGPHVAGKMPTLTELLTHNGLEMVMADRLTGKAVAKFHDVRPTSYATSLGSKSLEEVTITFIALRLDDESVDNVETAGATDLP